MDEPPLLGVKVIELTLAIAGPSAGATLADYGADVVKVEPPTGDTQRYLISGYTGKANPDPYKDSPHFYQVNRGKRSIVLDLKSEAGTETLHALLAKADVFLSNYRYESLEKLGLGCDALSRRHPHLIICPMTGWGMEGPDSGKPVYDVGGFWARSGAAYTHLDVQDPKAFPPALAPGFGDMTTGLAAVGGICAALVQRARTGRGRVLTTNLLRTGVFVNSWSMANYFAHGRQIGWGSRTSGGNPLLMVFRAADGVCFWLLGAEAGRHWPPTCKAMGHPEWMEREEFKTGGARKKNIKRLMDSMDAVFAEHPFAHWAALFDREGVWFQRVLQPKEVADDLQALASGAWVDAPMSAAAKAAGRSHVRQVAAPVAFIGVDSTPRRPVPTLGEHTAEVLEEAGVPNHMAQAVLAVAEDAVKSKL